MSFIDPLVLVGLLAIPLLVWWYVSEQRRRTGPRPRSRPPG